MSIDSDINTSFEEFLVLTNEIKDNVARSQFQDPDWLDLDNYFYEPKQQAFLQGNEIYSTSGITEDELANDFPLTVDYSRLKDSEENSIVVLSEFKKKWNSTSPSEPSDLSAYNIWNSLGYTVGENNIRVPPKPPNCYILFRRNIFHMVKKELTTKFMRLPTNAELSSECARRWKLATNQEKIKFKKIADELSLQHKKMFPNHKFIYKKKVKTNLA